ncbi:hypothetical protein GGU11DRAFT_409776 [Lentinula aff. detonsa]|nr:hypothetical protein GGU11DRAFT_409776 [Lentinula aff. detonsa]
MGQSARGFPRPRRSQYIKCSILEKTFPQLLVRTHTFFAGQRTSVSSSQLVYLQQPTLCFFKEVAMRFNTSLIVLGLAAAVSAVPVAGPPAPSTPNEAGIATEPANNLTARDFGIEVGSAGLNRRDYEVSVTFNGATCDGEATPEGKGTIKGGAKKRKNAAVLWTQV